jgi:hypothetical protein
MKPVGQEALFQVQPDALDRIEFGRVGRQRDQRDVAGNAQRARAVPARLIEYHGHVLVLADGRREAVQELLHCIGVDIGHDEREGIVRTRLNGGEDVGEGEALVGKTLRPLAARPPDMTSAPLLTDARLVLEKQADALVFMRTLNFCQQRRGSF